MKDIWVVISKAEYIPSDKEYNYSIEHPDWEKSLNTLYHTELCWSIEHVQSVVLHSSKGGKFKHLKTIHSQIEE